MSRLKSALGLGALSALCLCVFGAASASAMTLHECKEGAGTGTTYTSATCETAGEGSFQTAPIVETQGVKATGTSSFTLSATIAGVKFTITCSGLESVEAKAQNEESGGEMFVSGEGRPKFTGCAVTAPVGKGCVVPATIETVNLSWKTVTGASMGVKSVPKAGEELVTFPVTKCTTEALNGNKVFKGSLVSETKTPTTQAFTTTSGSTVTFGGQAATFVGDFHLSTPDGTRLAFETP